MAETFRIEKVSHDEETYDINDLKRILKASGRSIDRWRDSGVIPGGLRVGRLIRWRKRDIHEWLDAGCPRRSVKGGN